MKLTTHLYSELSHYKKIRFNASNTCIICSKEIKQFQPFVYDILKDGKRKLYLFAHEECYKNNNYNELVSYLVKKWS